MSLRTLDLLDGLNPEQRDAVLHDNGPLLIVAGAGSGKTRVLTHRITHLIRERGVSPYGILAITFTNKAAGEMKHRVAGLVGDVAERMWVSTFHAACVRILRRDGHQLGYTSNFTVYDQQDAVRLAGYVLRDKGMDTKKFPARGVQASISNAKNELLTPEELAERGRSNPYEKRIAEVYQEYNRRLLASNAMDFDDLLVNVVKLFREHPDVLLSYQQRFLHVLVDEYQDTNMAQNEIILQLAKLHRNVCVVGDSDQSIYRFRGADIRNILDFENAFPDVTTIVLAQNYRSTQTILDAANAVISNNEQRKHKDLWTSIAHGEKVTRYIAEDEYDEAQWITYESDKLHRGGQVEWGDIAIFYRANSQSRAVEERLTRAGIPYKVVGGTKFYERKEIKDLLAYLRLIANPTDEVSFERVVNVPKRGVGDTSLAKLREYAAANLISLWDAARDADSVGIGPRAAYAIKSFVALIDDLRARTFPTPPTIDEPEVLSFDFVAPQEAAEQATIALDAPLTPAEILEEVLNATGYLAELEAEKTIESAGRIENVAELVGVAREYEELDPFLEDTALVSDSDDLNDDQSSVVLMTMHSAKGLEFPVVFIVGLEDGVFPHIRSLTDPDELEEERRLAYVGITRARSRLYLTNAWSRSLWGGTQYNVPSRFLREIPEELVQLAPGSRQDSTAGGGGPLSYEDRREMEIEAAMRNGRAWNEDDDRPRWRDPEGGRTFGGGSGSSGDGRATQRSSGGARGGLRRDGINVSAADADRQALQRSRDAAVKKGSAATLDLKVGSDVVHPKYGEGVVIEIIGTGDRAEAIINFADFGEKRLILAWAPLKLAK
jgi:DNA helicase-2/ATP-dependent DNA helicase PcrA